MSATRPPQSKPSRRSSRVMRAVQDVSRRSLARQEAKTGPERADAPDGVISEELITRMLESLELTGDERALLVGASSAYEAALLSRLVREVYVVEPDAARMKDEQRLLDELGCTNVEFVSAEPRAGFPSAAPYQVILVAAALPSLPMRLIDQLDGGGRLVVALGDKESQLMTRLRRHPDSVECDTICACSLAMLGGARHISKFPWNKPVEPVRREPTRRRTT